MKEQFYFEKIEDYRKTREALMRDIYARYKDTTITWNNFAPNIFISLTNIPKSPFDNVVGWIKLR